MAAVLLAAVAAVVGAGCSGSDPPSLAAQDEPRPAAVDGQPVRVALVLSGGGLRGFAHLGVLRALEAQGLEPDLIVGTSIGAIVGALVASGWSAARMEAELAPPDIDPWGSLLVAPSTRSARLEAYLLASLKQRHIEDFPRRFVAVATERESGCVMAFGGGDAARALVASAALPGALAPVRVAGREYVDGGVGTPLPVRVARALGAQRVIAVDVTFHPEKPLPAGIVGSVFHAGMLMARHLAAADRDSADLVLEPVLPPVPEVTTENRARIVDAGARAAAEAAVPLRALFAAGALPATKRAGGSGLRMCAMAAPPSAVASQGSADEMRWRNPPQ